MLDYMNKNYYQDFEVKMLNIMLISLMMCVHIHFSFLLFCVCVNGNRVPFSFILCNFIAIFFSAWPSHLARLALAISKCLCSFFFFFFNFSLCMNFI